MTIATEAAAAHATASSLRDRALAIHRNTCIADLHSHALIGCGYLGFEVRRPRPAFRTWNPLRNLFDLVDLPRAREGGLGVVVFTAYVLPRMFGTYLARTEAMIDTLRQVLERSDGRAAFAQTAADVERIRG